METARRWFDNYKSRIYRPAPSETVEGIKALLETLETGEAVRIYNNYLEKILKTETEICEMTDEELKGFQDDPQGFIEMTDHDRFDRDDDYFWFDSTEGGKLYSSSVPEKDLIDFEEIACYIDDCDDDFGREDIRKILSE